MNHFQQMQREKTTSIFTAENMGGMLYQKQEVLTLVNSVDPDQNA